MSDLTPGFIVLNQGLDLQSPKIAAPPGTLLDMLNYEQVDFQGQKRIDGYVRYDGSLGSYQDELYRVTFNTEGLFATKGAIVTLDGKLVGVATSVSGNAITLSVLNHNLIPEVGQLLTLDDEATYEVYQVVSLSAPNILTEQEQYESILESNSILREKTTELPGPVAGLHWFNDRLYAVASVAKVDMGGDISTTTYPNENHNGYDILKVDGRYAYVQGLDLGDTSSDMASLFQSRTEQQALDELGDANKYGWEFVHQGWSVPFENGISLYGDLAALNQNRKGVGVEGPTSTTGNNGKPLSVTQKVEIVNLPPQVNGWKTSNSRTTYNLDVNALDAVDDWTIYADAFFSWDGETGIISSTGIHSGALVEYSPIATIEVEI